MAREEAVNIMSQMIKDEEGFLSDNTVEAHKMAIKALEQEPMVEIDLDYVIKQKYIERDVLDKIRAEIEHVIDNTYDSTDHDKSLYNGAYKDGLYDALDIIDKYKAESEG